MSPYHLSLLHFLNKKLPCQCALQLFSISASTYTQAKNLQQPPLLDVKYKPHIQQQQVSEERQEVAEQFIITHAPVQSSHDTHLKLKDDKQFYANYVKAAEEVAPDLQVLSKSYFIYTMLYGKHNVKNLKNPEFCPACEAAWRTNLPPQKCEKVEKHKTKAYQEQKEKVAQGQADECLVVLDFSQFSLEKGFHQVLIIIIYTHNSEAPDGLHCHYLDYVSKKNVSSNVNFIARVWQDLMT